MIKYINKFLIMCQDHKLKKGKIEVGIGTNIFEIQMIFKGGGKLIIGNYCDLGRRVQFQNSTHVTVNAGSPAIKIGDRFPNRIVEQLQELKWWYWSKEKMRRNKKFFQYNLSDKKEIDMSIIC